MSKLPSFFPSPINGETVYSLCSRYHLLSGNRSDAYTFRQLIPQGYPKLTSLFPSYLGELSKACGITPAALITKHTGLPLFRAFTDRKRYEEAILAMKRIDAGGLHRKMSIIANGVYAGFPLRHCTLCNAEDISLYGTTIWRVCHQLPMIDICHKHGARLKVQSESRRCFRLPPVSNHSNPIQPALNNNTKLARLAANCWERHHGFLSLERVVDSYRSRLTDLGYITIQGRIRQSLLAHDLQDYWLGKLTIELQLHLRRLLIGTAFPDNLLRGKPGNYHPIKHFFLIGLLFDDLEEFFWLTENLATSGSISTKQPGSQSVAPQGHDESELIADLKLGLSLRETSRRHGRSVSYVRERALSNGFPVARRRQKLTEEIERTAWRKLFLGMPTKIISRELNISVSVIESIMRCHPYLQALRSRIRKYQSVKLHREICTRYFQRHPTAHRNHFRAKHGRSYDWLYRNDRHWLTDNLPMAIERKSRRNHCRSSPDLVETFES